MSFVPLFSIVSLHFQAHSRELPSFPVSVSLIRLCSVHCGLSQAAGAMFSGQKLCILISASHFPGRSRSSSCGHEYFSELSSSRPSTRHCSLLQNMKRAAVKRSATFNWPTWSMLTADFWVCGGSGSVFFLIDNTKMCVFACENLFLTFAHFEILLFGAPVWDWTLSKSEVSKVIAKIWGMVTFLQVLKGLFNKLKFESKEKKND